MAYCWPRTDLCRAMSQVVQFCLLFCHLFSSLLLVPKTEVYSGDQHYFSCHCFILQAECPYVCLFGTIGS